MNTQAGRKADDTVDTHRIDEKTIQRSNVHTMAHSLRSPYTVQAVRPTRHWWRCPRVLAWFRVLMVWSLVKPPASVGPLSRIGDYLFAARGPGLLLRIRRRTTFPPKSAVTRGPPHPLFHRR